MQRVLLIFAILFWVRPLSAQIEQPLTISNPPPRLKLTFPAHRDTFALDRVRIAGGTEPDAIVLVNHRRVYVYPHGAFVTRVPLQEGENTIVVQARRNGTTARDTLFIYHPPALRTSPERPTQIDPAVIEPSVDLWVMPGDLVHVRFKGSPGGMATFSIDRQEKNIGMTELDSAITGGLRGIYTGVYRIKETTPNKPLKVQFELRGVDGEKAKIKAPGKIYLLRQEVPIIGITREQIDLWDAPQGGARLGEIDSTVHLRIVGKVDSRYKVALGQRRHAYVDGDNIKILPVGTPLPHTGASSPSISVGEKWYRLGIRVDVHVPYLVEQSVDPPRLDLYLFGAHQGSQWTTYPNQPIEITDIQWSQIDDDVLRIRISLAQKQQWGYKVAYDDNQLVFSVHRSPIIAKPPASPVKGLTIVLDPGHGGTEQLGAISPTGIAEKDVNLKWAQYLAEKLRLAGANVVLTREDDSEVTLRERVELARDVDADIFISLHNNAVGAASNAAAVRGTSVFYNRSQSKALAWSIYPHLVSLGLDPMGRSATSFYVNRNTAMPAVLLEGAFMSNPNDEQLMLQDSFWQKMAQAVFDGLEEFLASQREEQKDSN